MPYKCSLQNCKGNYDSQPSCSVYKLPADERERKEWIRVLPNFSLMKVDLPSFRICRRHWPKDVSLVKIGGRSRPSKPPSVFNVPLSSLPTPKPPLRKPKQEYALQSYFDKKHKIMSFETFSPEKEIKSKYAYVYDTVSQLLTSYVRFAVIKLTCIVVNCLP